MDINKESSDEKLLKLIETADAIRHPRKIGIKDQAKNLIRLRPRFNFKFKSSAYKPDKIVFALCGLITAYFIYNLFSGAKKLSAELVFPPAKSASGLSKALSIQDGLFLGPDEYIGEIKKRNVFVPPQLRNQTQSDIDIPALVQDLKLVGVIWSGNPEVMVESARENRTFLLKKNDTFTQEQIKIKDITRTSVVLEIDTEDGKQEYELR
jgi:type II secretory pathway component PulC